MIFAVGLGEEKKMFRYGVIENGQFTGEISYENEEWPPHVQKKMREVARLIVTVDPVPDRPEYFVKLAPAYQVEDLEIREIYTYEIHPGLKEIRKGEISALRDEKLNQGVVFDGSRYDSDDRAQLRITGTVVGMGLAVQAGQAPEPAEWVKMDNSATTLTLPELIALGQMITAHVSACVHVAREHKAKLDEISLEDVMTYDITQGWPE